MRFAEFHRPLLGILVCLCCFHSRSDGQVASERPNVIYIYADDLGYGDLGAYGQAAIMTPHIDKLAAEGMRFTQHYTGSPVCAPARCILLTGRHSGHAFIRGNYELGGFEDSQEGGQMPLPEGTFTIAHLLKQAGYATGAIGKWGLGIYGSSGAPDRMGFDYFFGYLDQKQAHNYYPTHLWEQGSIFTLKNQPLRVHQALRPDEQNPDSFARFLGREYAPDLMIRKAGDFIKQHQHQPFFLYYAIPLPHLSLQVPDSAQARYRGRWKEEPYRGEQGYASTLSPKSSYAAMVTYLDSMVGLVLKQVHDLGLDKKTLIMLSSDNGATFQVGGFNSKWFASNGGLRGSKQQVYEGGIRVPFIARWPGRIPAGKVSSHISAQYDLLPTLVDLIGLPSPASDGLSMLPTLLNLEAVQQQHPFLYFEFPERGGQVAIRMGRWKGVKMNMKENPGTNWEIYDLEIDPGERVNLALKRPDLAESFDKFLRNAHHHPHIREWEFIDPKFPSGLK